MPSSEGFTLFRIRLPSDNIRTSRPSGRTGTPFLQEQSRKWKGSPALWVPRAKWYQRDFTGTLNFLMSFFKLPGPSYVDVVTWHHTGEQSSAAFRHLDVIGSCGDPQVGWKTKRDTSVNFFPTWKSSQSHTFTLNYSGYHPELLWCQICWPLLGAMWHYNITDT